MRLNQDAQRLEMLDALRGIAAICVAVYHFTENTSFPLAHMATYFVDVFFVMSGFIIAMKYRGAIDAGMGFRDFLARRLIRLYPVFAVSICIGAVALALKCSLAMASYSPGDVVLATALNALFLPFHNDGRINLLSNYLTGLTFPLNPPAWSLFYELIACAAFYVYARSGRNVTPWIVAASGTAMFVLILQGGGSGGPASILGVDAIARVTFSFFAGVLVCEARRSGSTWSVAAAGPRPFWPALAGILALAVLAFWQGEAERYILIFVLAFAPFVVWSATSARMPSALRSTSRALGLLSYPIYCLHCPLMNLWEGLGTALHLAPSEGRTIALAAISTACLACVLALRFETKLRSAMGRGFGRAATQVQPFPANWQEHGQMRDAGV